MTNMCIHQMNTIFLLLVFFKKDYFISENNKRRKTNICTFDFLLFFLPFISLWRYLCDYSLLWYRIINLPPSWYMLIEMFSFVPKRCIMACALYPFFTIASTCICNRPSWTFDSSTIVISIAYFLLVFLWVFIVHVLHFT